MVILLSKMNKMLTVGKAAQKLGLNPQTIYFYERIGLIPYLQRSSSGYRLFEDKDIERLSFIDRAKSLGLSLEEIKEILTLEEKQSLSCCELNYRLSEKIAQIQEKIIKLQELREELINLLGQCSQRINHSKNNSNCTILREVLQDINSSKPE